MTRRALAVFVAGSTTAQPDMLVTVEDFNGDDSWSITAEFLSTPPSPIVQLWADASFRLTGDGSDITFTDYNPAYDTSLADAEIVNGPIASFAGFASLAPFFGTPDSSNPLYVASFDYSGSFADLSLFLFGQNSAVFELQPFGDVQLYTGGGLGPFPLTFDVLVIPLPGTLMISPIALLATRRRR
ncbi:MAG: hypothetical protein AAGJ54_10985 [Planctomycetota bacterium]